MSILINQQDLEGFIKTIQNEFKELNLSFQEIDEVLFFIDLDNKDYIVEAINKRDQLSKEIVRDLVLIKRKEPPETILHYKLLIK